MLTSRESTAIVTVSPLLDLGRMLPQLALTPEGVASAPTSQRLVDATSSATGSSQVADLVRLRVDPTNDEKGSQVADLMNEKGSQVADLVYEKGSQMADLLRLRVDPTDELHLWDPLGASQGIIMKEKAAKWRAL